jgi:hypothetical protein
MEWGAAALPIYWSRSGIRVVCFDVAGEDFPSLADEALEGDEVNPLSIPGPGGRSRVDALGDFAGPLKLQRCGVGRVFLVVLAWFTGLTLTLRPVSRPKTSGTSGKSL